MQLIFGSPLNDADFQRWATDALRAIELASAEDIEAVVSEFTITGTLVETRTLNVDSATHADLLSFVATLITDIQKSGQKRGYATG